MLQLPLFGPACYIVVSVFLKLFCLHVCSTQTIKAIFDVEPLSCNLNTLLFYQWLLFHGNPVIPNHLLVALFTACNILQTCNRNWIYFYFSYSIVQWTALMVICQSKVNKMTNQQSWLIFRFVQPKFVHQTYKIETVAFGYVSHTGVQSYIN